MSKFLKFFGIDNEDDYEDEDGFPEEEISGRGKSRRFDAEEEEEEPQPRQRTKRVVVPEQRRLRASSSVIIYSPKSYNEAQPLVEDLNANKHVIVKFDKVDRKVAQRILDFMSGAAYATDAQVSEVSKGSIYLFASKTTSIDQLDQTEQTSTDAGFKLDEEEDY